MILTKSTLILLLATLSLAEPSPSSANLRPLHPHNPLAEAISSSLKRNDAGNTTTTNSSTDGADKVLRYSLQQKQFNGTAATTARRRRQQHKARRRDAMFESDEEARLVRREKWNWKHLEDYRGYLYFMESKFSFQSPS